MTPINLIRRIAKGGVEQWVSNEQSRWTGQVWPTRQLCFRENCALLGLWCLEPQGFGPSRSPHAWWSKPLSIMDICHDMAPWHGPLTKVLTWNPVIYFENHKRMFLMEWVRSYSRRRGRWSYCWHETKIVWEGTYHEVCSKVHTFVLLNTWYNESIKCVMHS